MMMKNLGGGGGGIWCSLKSANHSSYFSLLLPFVITSHQEMCGVDLSCDYCIEIILPKLLFNTTTYMHISLLKHLAF